MGEKPLGKKSYGSIPHLPESRLGPGDHKCEEGQARIATEKVRDKYDTVIVQEKLDGSNVAVAKINNEIIPLTRSGYRANTSKYQQHIFFDKWVNTPNILKRFKKLLNEGERICGEWLCQAHGTRYDLNHEPFVVFDIMRKNSRLPFNDFKPRVEKYDFIIPNTIHIGGSLSIESAMKKLKVSGHGALDPVEGAIWRVERSKKKSNQSFEREYVVDFLVKYVRKDKEDGIYFPKFTKCPPIYNWIPHGYACDDTTSIYAV